MSFFLRAITCFQSATCVVFMAMAINHSDLKISDLFASDQEEQQATLCELCRDIRGDEHNLWWSWELWAIKAMLCYSTFSFIVVQDTAVKPWIEETVLQQKSAPFHIAQKWLVENFHNYVTKQAVFHLIWITCSTAIWCVNKKLIPTSKLSIWTPVCLW